MIANPFRYRCYDLVTGGLITELPFGQVSFGRQVNQAGPWQGTLQIADPRVQKLAWQDATNPWRAGLFVDFLGTLVWGGPIITRSYDEEQDPNVIKVGAREFGAYFAQRRQQFDYSTTFTAGADPMLIAQRVVTDALGVSGSTIMGGIQVALHPAGGEGGPLVSPSYPGTAPQSIDSILQILSQMGYGLGFDYSFDVAYLAGVPQVTMNIFYPRQGRTYAQSGIVIEKKDCKITYPEDGGLAANDVLETGSGTGNVQPAGASIVIAGFPLLQRVFPRTQVNDDSTLANIAESDLHVNAYPVETPTVKLPLAMPRPDGTVDPGQLTFGQFGLGDDMLLRIGPVAGAGNNTSARFPNGMSFEWRMSAWTCTVAEQGVSTLLFDLAIPPSATIPPPPPPGAS